MNKEKILRIEETNFDSNGDCYEGFVIVTDLQSLKIGISSEQSCCERFGVIMTNDDVEYFIGSYLSGVSIVDSLLENKKIEELEYLDCGDAMFVNLETSAGLLQFVAYNSHNGYYGHEAVLISKEINHNQYL